MMEMRIDWTNLAWMDDLSECSGSIIMLSTHTYLLFYLG
jgi:hypothetical protein